MQLKIVIAAQHKLWYTKKFYYRQLPHLSASDLESQYSHYCSVLLTSVFCIYVWCMSCSWSNQILSFSIKYLWLVSNKRLMCWCWVSDILVTWSKRLHWFICFLEWDFCHRGNECKENPIICCFNISMSCCFPPSDTASVVDLLYLMSLLLHWRWNCSFCGAGNATPAMKRFHECQLTVVLYQW